MRKFKFLQAEKDAGAATLKTVEDRLKKEEEERHALEAQLDATRQELTGTGIYV